VSRAAAGRGLAQIGGAVGVLILIITVLSGGLTLAQLWRTAETLQAAARFAADAEAQAGCWTDTAAQTAATALAGGGLTPRQVTVTAYSPPGAYGASMVAGFAAPAPVAVLGVPVGSVTLQAQAVAPSLWVPPAPGVLPSGCTAPPAGTPAFAATATALQGGGSGPYAPAP